MAVGRCQIRWPNGNEFSVVWRGNPKRGVWQRFWAQARDHRQGGRIRRPVRGGLHQLELDSGDKKQ